MKTRHILTALLLMLAGVQQAWAQKVVLYTTDQETIEFDFADLDSITFSEESVAEDMWVDLGLPSGTLWATCNIGAKSPEDFGYYFAWGETEPKDNYTWETYKWMTSGKADWSFINKYTFADNQTSGSWYSAGEFVGDGKQELDQEDDAATAVLGDKWQMPSVEQIYELINTSYTKSEWIMQKGVYGRKVTSLSNGNSIFLPAAGWRSGTSTVSSGSIGYYWSNSLGGLSSDYAFPLYFLANYWGVEHHERFCGHPIRPVRVKEKPQVVPEYVDLGLPSGTLWATFNVGASKPEEYGDYFAWGETEPKSEYGWTGNYKYVQDSKLTKYCTESTLGDQGNVDGKLLLDPEDDAATANWGSEWQTPTYEQQLELRAYTTIIWTKLNGVNGMLLTSKRNGNTLFLPAAGSMDGTTLNDETSKGHYWASMVGINMSANSHRLSFDASTTQDKWETSDGWDIAGRVFGYSVRPVRVKEEVHEYVDLGLPSGTLWATTNIGARRPSEFGDYFAWGETEPKDEYTWNTYKYGSGEKAITKYCVDSEFGTVDNKTELEPEDDAATVNWGSEWQMPSKEQIVELVNEEYTTTTWTTKEGFYGRLITSKVNGKSIFLPAAGVWRDEAGLVSTRTGGGCWSRSILLTSSSSHFLFFNSEAIDRFSIYRYWGLNVRPVRVKKAAKEYVDLGLPSGTMWATSNVGALSPEEAGERFAWGETQPKDDYSWDNYKYGTETTLTKYNTNDEYGDKDGTFELRAIDDAAASNWGSDWQTPSSEQFLELMNNQYTKTEQATINGVPCMKITSRTNGNYILMPVPDSSDTEDDAKTYGFYWSRSLNSNPFCAGMMALSSSNWVGFFDKRYNSHYVRPVRKQEVVHELVDLGLPSHTQWATMNVGATCPEEFGDYFAWGETEPKSYYSWGNYKYCKMSDNTLTKYCKFSEEGFNSYTDNRTMLEWADDAASINWGDDYWQTPSKEQFEELINPEYTTLEIKEQRGITGLLVTSKSNNMSIFLPAARERIGGEFAWYNYGHYMTNTIYPYSSAYSLYLTFDINDITKTYISGQDRSNGRTVRPVRLTIN